MIGYLQGVIIDIMHDSIIIGTNGVGYRVDTKASKLSINEEISLYIHTHVREQELKLFGFATKQELGLFEMLITVSGVGPKLAMALVSSLGYDEIVSAIIEGQPKLLKSPGIGQKTAERIIIDLKSKLKQSAHQGVLNGRKTANPAQDEVHDALIGLGFSETEISKALESIDPQLDAGNLIKEALKVIRNKSNN
ncbi:Holliday junction branch migration protein RuvA [Candidatus Dojkabacteria bacterium]|uniref:Holliday junction branch migration complex subunit RuvA n=1 Tax=Candidatus Dojkabacteria bacterium TaxID=2099670 RepID=A0A952DV35_9BACT|nr:Holliday junction branch migration protein RuvA [Candidatus Dojkabacteria bacterium]